MTRKLNKKIWPYCYEFKVKYDEHEFEIDEDEILLEREKWLFENLNENIRQRVYITQRSDRTSYYFQREEDYNWFIWRWI